MTSAPTSIPANKDTASPAPSSRSSVENADAPTSSVPTAYVSDKADDSSKLRTFLSILRKSVPFSPARNAAKKELRPPTNLFESYLAIRHRSYMIVGADWISQTRFIGVADIASVRFSLPAQLLEPIPNLGIQFPDPMLVVAAVV